VIEWILLQYYEYYYIIFIQRVLTHSLLHDYHTILTFILTCNITNLLHALFRIITFSSFYRIVVPFLHVLLHFITFSLLHIISLLIHDYCVIFTCIITHYYNIIMYYYVIITILLLHYYNNTYYYDRSKYVMLHDLGKGRER
jgi:hypothetical protein